LCSTCHLDPNGGGPRNSFGRAYPAAGYTWQGALCNADSDGDGYSNGVELGDPDCNGVANVNAALSRPGEGASTPCGNGTLEGPEVCDGANLNGKTCADEGFGGGGTLACAANCKAFDTTGCMMAPIDMGGDPDMEPDMEPDMAADMAPDMETDMPADMEDMPADMPPDPDMLADMAVEPDMAPDMTFDMALGEDMTAQPDMGVDPVDMAAGEDMTAQADMSSGQDMASQPDMSDVSVGGGGADDESCAQVGVHAAARGFSGGLLALLALLGLARRRARRV
jgi:hypothetical protein